MEITPNKNYIKSDISYIIIACCTYKRNLFLGNALNSLLKLDLPSNIKTEILIVDNDKNGSAKNVVAKYQEISEIKIHYTIEDRLGFASVRNTALNKAIELGASHLAFIDDDEIAPKEWVLNHVEFYKNNSDIVISSAPTYKKFKKEYPKYITQNKVFKKTTTKKHGQLRNCCATGNVFFPLDIVTRNSLYFSEDFNYSGGEDGDFFRRAHSIGLVIGWNDKATNYELIGDERANIKWILNRCFNDGYSGSIIKFKNKRTSAKRFFYILEKMLLIPINTMCSIILIFFGRTIFFNSLVLTVKNIGKLIGAITLAPELYYQKREVHNG